MGEGRDDFGCDDGCGCRWLLAGSAAVGIDLDGRGVVDAMAAVCMAHAHRVCWGTEAEQERGGQQGEQAQQRGKPLLRGAGGCAGTGAGLHDVSIEGLDF